MSQKFITVLGEQKELLNVISKFKLIYKITIKFI